MTARPSVALTCDVEVKNDAGLRQFRQLIDLADALDVPITFFVEYRPDDRGAAREGEKVRAMLAGGRHETGLHIHWHGAYGRGIAGRTRSEFDTELAAAIALAQQAGAPRPDVFRSGGLCCSTEMLHALAARGFRVDRSVAPGLNEPSGWRQGHGRVPHTAWYAPDVDDYASPAGDSSQALDLLEVPVTRLRPSWPFWRGCTLQPGAALARVMLRQALSRPQAFANIITHSWGAGALRGERFGLFLARTAAMIASLRARQVSFVRIGELGRLRS